MNIAKRNDIGLQLHMIISRLGRENGNPDEMSTLGEAAARILQLEQAMRDLLKLMGDTPYLELQPAVRRSRELLDDQ